jgi:excisionase family DNA binding protein
MAGLITTIEAAKALDISQNRVNALIRSGRLPAQKYGWQWLIDRKDLAKVRVRKPGRPPKKSR